MFFPTPDTAALPVAAPAALPTLRAPAPRAGSLGRLELGGLPLPHTLAGAMKLLARSESPDVRAVTALVERDPLVTAHLLQRVNAAFYGLHRRVCSPERAVALLGPVAAVGAIVAAGLSRRARPAADGAAACVQRLALHSLATAHLARYLVEEAPYAPGTAPSVRDGAAFTAGLLHDLGKLVLAHNAPESAAALYDDGALRGLIATADAREAERLVFGCDHTEAGAYAAMRLNLPEAVADVIRLHHDPAALAGRGVMPETGRLLRAVAVASRAADAVGLGGSPAGTSSWDAVADGPAMAALVARDLPAFGTPTALAAHLRAYAETVAASASLTAGSVRTAAA